MSRLRSEISRPPVLSQNEIEQATESKMKSTLIRTQRDVVSLMMKRHSGLSNLK